MHTQNLDNNLISDLETVSYADIQNSLSSLENSFCEFKKHYDERWSALYRKGFRYDEEKGAKNFALTDRKEENAFISYLRTGKLDLKSLTASDESGSFMIPHGVQESIFKATDTYSKLRKICRIMSVSTPKVDVVLDDVNAEAGWVNEKGGRDETVSPEVRKLSVHIHELYAKPRISQHLLEDSFLDLSQWIAQKIAEKMAKLETLAFLFGNGENRPEGLLSAEKTLSQEGEKDKVVSFKTGTDGDIRTTDALIQAMTGLSSDLIDSACWVMGRTALASILKLKEDGTGRHVFHPALSEKTPSTLLGHPILLIDEMPKVLPGIKSDAIMFGNFKRAYQIIDRKGFSILRDPYSAKPYVEFYATKRVGGAILDKDAYKIISFSA